MKKLISFVLLFTFLFHVAGYYVGYLALHYHAQRDLAHHLDDGDYSALEILTFKIPLTVPYYPDSQEYERVDGAFEYRGEFFKLVKQKLEDDTLYVVCIKDHKEKSLFRMMTDFAKLSTDLPVQHNAQKLMGSLTKEYVSTTTVKSPGQQGWSFGIGFAFRIFELLDTDLPVFSPPPDVAG